jgi:hypothetical protein
MAFKEKILLNVLFALTARDPCVATLVRLSFVPMINRSSLETLTGVRCGRRIVGHVTCEPN